MKFFKFHTPKFHQKKLGEKKNVPLLEIAAIAALLGTDIERVKLILENKLEIHGWQTIQHGVWHSDPNGDTIAPITGERGYYTFETLAKDKKNLLTNGGRDFFHAQVYTNTSAGTRGGNFVAVSSNAGGADAAHTSLAGEIASGGLTRADADTKSHTGGTNVSTVEHTFTASAQQVDVQLSGLFNASTVGTLTHENTFTAATLEINDTLKVTWTLTLG